MLRAARNRRSKVSMPTVRQKEIEQYRLHAVQPCQAFRAAPDPFDVEGLIAAVTQRADNAVGTGCIALDEKYALRHRFGFRCVITQLVNNWSTLRRNAKFGGALIGPGSLHGIVFLSSGSQSWTEPALDQCWNLHAAVACSANRGGDLQQ